MARTSDPQRQQERREHIMLTAFQLLTERSHHGMTLDSVAQTMGVSKGMVSYYFPNKEALIVATIDSFLTLHHRTLVMLAEQKKPVRERMADLVLAILPSSELLRARASFVAEVWSFTKTSPAALAAVQRTYAEFFAACGRLVALGIEEGYVTAKDDERVLVSIMALFDGLALRAVYAPETNLEVLRRSAMTAIDRLVV